MDRYQWLQEIVSQIKYKDWTLRVNRGQDMRPYLQVVFFADCTVSGKHMMQIGRKWWLSPHMCKGEVVSTAYKAIEGAEMHEMREHFRYRGVAIYNPHIDPDALLEVAEKLDVREER